MERVQRTGGKVDVHRLATALRHSSLMADVTFDHVGKKYGEAGVIDNLSHHIDDHEPWFWSDRPAVGDRPISG